MMAPVSNKGIIRCHQISSKIPSLLQSRIPIRNPETGKPRTTGVAKCLTEKTNSIKQIVKPGKPVVKKGVDGRVNIIKPIIKKKSQSPVKNLEWTKSKPQSISRKSIGKAKNRNPTFLKKAPIVTKQSAIKQTTLPTSFHQKNGDKKLTCASVEKEKENEVPSIAISRKVSHDHSLEMSPASKSMKALKDTLNFEFVPNEFFRNQILNNKGLSFAQLKQFSPTPTKQKAKTLVKQMERMTISSVSKLQRNSSRGMSLIGSSSKYGKKTPLPTKKLPSQAIRRCTWTPNVSIQSQTKRVITPYEEAVKSIRLSERKSSLAASKSKARVALFQSTENNVDTSPDVSRRVTWAPGIKVLGKKMDPYEKALFSLTKLKDRELTPLTDEEKRCSWTLGKKSPRQRLSPYEIAMAKLKELKTKPLRSASSSPAFFTPAKSPWTSIDTHRTPLQHVNDGTPLFQKALCGSGSKSRSALKNGSPGQSTPRRVSFNLSSSTSPSVYRPLRTLLTKSILKPQTRLTDISEHSENDNTRSSHGSNKDSDTYPGNASKKNGSSGIMLIVSEPTPPLLVSAVVDNNSANVRTTSVAEKVESVVCTPFSHNVSLPPSSKQRKLMSAFTSKSRHFSDENNVTLKNFFPPIGNFVESTNSTSSAEPSTPLFTPKALSFFTARQSSPDEFFEACCTVTPSHDAPICTPLVLKSIARSNRNKEILSPIKQKLEFDDMEAEDVIKPCKDEFQWTPRFSLYGGNSLTRSQRDDMLADKECEKFLGNERRFFSNCRDFLNPIAKSLSFGDDMHFLPIIPK